MFYFKLKTAYLLTCTLVLSLTISKNTLGKQSLLILMILTIYLCCKERFKRSWFPNILAFCFTAWNIFILKINIVFYSLLSSHQLWLRLRHLASREMLLLKQMTKQSQGLSTATIINNNITAKLVEASSYLYLQSIWLLQTWKQILLASCSSIQRVLWAVSIFFYLHSHQHIYIYSYEL